MTPREHVGQGELQIVKFLDIQNRIRQLRLNHMYNIFHSIAPPHISQFFTRTSQIHRYTTRSNPMNFWVPRVDSVTAKSFYYQATLDWNGLPQEIKNIQNKSSFKKAVRIHLSTCAMTHELAAYVY